MELSIVVEREQDGRWIAEVPELAGVLVYGATQAEAMARAQVLAPRVLADRIEHCESGPPGRSHPAAQRGVSQWPSVKARAAAGAFPDRLAGQATVRLAPHPFPPGLAGLRVRFHDGEEIGPRMLARVARHTGLSAAEL